MCKRILRVYQNKRENSYVTCHLTPQGRVFFEKLVVCPAGRTEVLYYSIHTINFKILYYRPHKGPLYYRLHKGPPLGPILRRFSRRHACMLRLECIGDASVELHDILPPDKMRVVSLSHSGEEAWCTLGA
jgi:hypothetical protein